MTVHTRQGSRIHLLAYAAGSDRDSVWALRLADGMVRCYYLHDVLLSNDIVHISAALPTLAELDKDAAYRAASLVKADREAHDAWLNENERNADATSYEQGRG